jgi:hypothetical protein
VKSFLPPGALYRVPSVRRSQWLSVVAALASCALLAACGGGDSKSSPSGGGSSSSPSSGGAALSKAELIKQGDKICKEGSDKVDKLGSSPSDPAALGDYAEKLTKIVGETVAGLRQLKPPADVASDYNRLLGLMERLEKDAGELPGVAKSADVAKLTALSKDLEKVATEGQQVANRIGFKGACTG